MPTRIKDCAEVLVLVNLKIFAFFFLIFCVNIIVFSSINFVEYAWLLQLGVHTSLLYVYSGTPKCGLLDKRTSLISGNFVLFQCDIKVY